MATRKTPSRRSAGGGGDASEAPALAAGDYGDYITLEGQRVPLVHHETDFQVLGDTTAPAVAAAMAAAPDAERSAIRMGPAAIRMHVPDEVLDDVMDEVRRDAVATHIYRNANTGEELTFSRNVVVKLRAIENDELLSTILNTFQLSVKGRQGGEFVLELSRSAIENPLKIANRIAEMEGVEYAQPEQVVSLQMHGPPLLLSRQWYLDAASAAGPDVRPESGIDVHEAWAITRGVPEIVVAVIDDGFQLQHPCFAGTTFHSGARDFMGQDQDPNPGNNDYHGTPVASIAVGAAAPNAAMSGVAPGCAFLPIRIGFGANLPFHILDVFRYVSQRADVVNCSFGTGPSTTPFFTPGFRSEMASIAETGGRRGRGLVMVFSAANDDVPTSFAAAANVNGFRFTRPALGGLVGAAIPAGFPIFTGYPSIPGVVTVGACTSLMRKSGYSNWGQEITVVAPSNNMHYNMEFLPPGDALRTPFVANYRGKGQVAASNRLTGSPFRPLPDNPLTTVVREDDYTQEFGGTSGAAPVVTGVAALMLSANPDLTAREVRSILMSTADRDMDASLDLANDPNIIPNMAGRPLGFVNGRSILFGSGKVNAARAVAKAKALVPVPTPVNCRVPAFASSNDTTGRHSATVMFCRVHGVFGGQMMVSGLSHSMSQVCGNSTVANIPEDPNRSPVGFCGTDPIWKVTVA